MGVAVTLYTDDALASGPAFLRVLLFMLTRTLRFGLVGVIGFLVDAGWLALLIGVAGPYRGRVVSFSIAVLVTWVCNRSFTFADRRSGLTRGREFGRYFAAMLGGGVVNYGTYALIVFFFGSGDWIPFIGLAAGSLAGMVINLTLANLVVFRA
jgi:putative flippase GtrA